MFNLRRVLTISFQVIELEFLDFELEDSNDCNKDSLIIPTPSDTGALVTEKYCGEDYVSIRSCIYTGRSSYSSVGCVGISKICAIKNSQFDVAAPFDRVYYNMVLVQQDYLIIYQFNI